MASLDVIALDPTVPQLRAPGVGDTYHFCRVVEFQDGTDAAPSITNVGDTNTGIYWPNADELAVSTGGVQRMSLGATTVFNETGADVDFRIEGDTDANLVFVDASTDRVGLGLNNPDRLLDVDGSSKFRGQILITSGEALGLGLQALQLPTGVESTIGAGLSTRTGVAGESIIQFGNNMNTYYTGSVNAAKAGAMIRIDTRGVEPTPGASAYSVFQIQTRAAGVADPNYTVPVQIGAAPHGTFCIQTNGLATFNNGLTVNSNFTLGSGTANGVLYLNGSKVATSGSALTFDGSFLGLNRTVGWASELFGLSGSSASQRFIYARSTSAGHYLSLGTNGTAPYIEYGNGAGLIFQDGASEQMRLTSTGLGIGVTPSAWASTYRALEGSFGQTWFYSNTSLETGLSSNATKNGANWIYKTTNAAYRYETGNLGHAWFIAPLGTAGNAISFTQAMTLDSSGNVGIGTSSPTTKLDVFGGRITHTLAGGGVQLVLGNSLNAVSLGSIEAGGDASLGFYTNTSTERMRLDQSGNLGIGVTPSAWSGIGKTLQINTGGSFSADSANAYFAANCYYNGTNWIYQTTNNATRYTMASNSHQWFTAPSGTAGNTISFTQAMTLDASGNLVLGETSTSYRFQIGNGTTTGVIRAGTAFTSIDSGYQSAGVYGTAAAPALIIGGDDNTGIWHPASDVLAISTGGSERARITSGGNFLVGTTSVTSSNFALQTISEEGILARGTANGGSSFLSTLTSGNSDGYHYYGYNTATTSAVFYVLYNGDVRNTNNSYAAISDIKLKEDVVDAASQWDDIKNLRVRKYRFKSDPTSPPQIGVIAQELEQVSPGLVEDVVDRDENNLDLGTITKSVKYSVLYMKAVKALQEAMARIESLEAKVAALEAK